MDETPLGRLMAWVARLLLPVKVLSVITMSEPPMLFAKRVLYAVTLAPAAVPMVAPVPLPVTKTLSRPSE